MKSKLLDSFYTSLEWRAIAFIITNIFFWVSTGSFWEATGLALLLQGILLFFHMSWYFWRKELHMPLFPHIKTDTTKEHRVHPHT